MSRPNRRRHEKPKSALRDNGAVRRRVQRRWVLRASSVLAMEPIVLRVRLLSGDNTDVTYQDRDAESADQVIDNVVATLGSSTGALRCRHGERLVVLFARGVAAVEVAPRGAVV